MSRPCPGRRSPPPPRRSCSRSPRWRRSPHCACSRAATSSAPDAREKFLRPAPPHGSIGGAMLPSYSNGPSTTPLLGETIGDNLDRMAARFPAREALSIPYQDVRMTYAELVEEANLV